MRVDGAKLRRARERRLLTQPELAARAGVMVATVSRIENGLQQPRIPTLRRLTEALGIAAEEVAAWDAEEGDGTGQAAT